MGSETYRIISNSLGQADTKTPLFASQNSELPPETETSSDHPRAPEWVYIIKGSTIIYERERFAVEGALHRTSAESIIIRIMTKTAITCSGPPQYLTRRRRERGNQSSAELSIDYTITSSDFDRRRRTRERALDLIRSTGRLAFTYLNFGLFGSNEECVIHNTEEREDLKHHYSNGHQLPTLPCRYPGPILTER
jgi:hypothetical protein